VGVAVDIPSRRDGDVGREFHVCGGGFGALGARNKWREKRDGTGGGWALVQTSWTEEHRKLV